MSCGSLLAGAFSVQGVAVVVDVFRAFTCLPLMFSLGLRRGILVGTTEEAFALKAQHPDWILAGEVGGKPVAGFDLGNSPSQILFQSPGFFEGKTAVQRTSSGVQGALAAIERAEEVLLASYCISGATARYLKGRSPEQVSIVAMGRQLLDKAPEDEWCSRYIAHLLQGAAYDHNTALREIIAQRTTQEFLSASNPVLPAEDPIICLQRDIYDFVVIACREGDLVVARRVDVS